MGSSPKSSLRQKDVPRLQKELLRLTKEHAAALEESVYSGMSVEEAKQFDARRTEIIKLIERLRRLLKLPR